MAVVNLRVPGMSCGHCERRIKQAVGGLAGVRTVEVDLGGKRVTVDYDEAAADVASLKEAVRRAGYDVEEV